MPSVNTRSYLHNLVRIHGRLGNHHYRLMRDLPGVGTSRKERGGYLVIVENGEGEVVSAIRPRNLKALENLAENYGWR